MQSQTDHARNISRLIDHFLRRIDDRLPHDDWGRCEPTLPPIQGDGHRLILHPPPCPVAELRLRIAMHPEQLVRGSINPCEPTDCCRADNHTIRDRNLSHERSSYRIARDAQLGHRQQLRPTELSRFQFQTKQTNFAVSLTNDKQIVSIRRRCSEEEHSRQLRLQSFRRRGSADRPQDLTVMQIVGDQLVARPIPLQRITTRQFRIGPPNIEHSRSDKRVILNHKQLPTVAAELPEVAIQEQQLSKPVLINSRTARINRHSDSPPNPAVGIHPVVLHHRQ